MGLPYFNFFPRDWLADTRVTAMSYELQGIYMRLLSIMWDESTSSDECSLPDEDPYLAGALHLSKGKWRKVRAVLIDGPHAVFTAEGGRITNKRLTSEWNSAKKRSQSARDNASKRWTEDKDNEQPYPLGNKETDDADASPTALPAHSDGNAVAMRRQCSPEPKASGEERDSRPTVPLPSVEEPPVVIDAAGVGRSPREESVQTPPGGEAARTDPPKRRTKQRDLYTPLVDQLRDELREATIAAGNDPSALPQDWPLKATGIVRRLLTARPSKGEPKPQDGILPLAWLDDEGRLLRLRNVMAYGRDACALRAHPAGFAELVAAWPRKLREWNITDKLLQRCPPAWRYRRLSQSQSNSLSVESETWEQGPDGKWRQAAGG